jgi:beta-N-acetylhexosaminidase
MNLAPVADLLTNPKNPVVAHRSYGSDPNLTGHTISQVLRGMQSGGVLATLMHFPGHGETSSDSHVDLPVLDLSQQRLDSTELVPFRLGIEAGAEAVMVAHIWYSTLSPEQVIPASLSPEVVTGLLREQMGFEGIILSDALDMDAIDRRYSYPQAAVMAVQAGADMLAMGPGIGLDTQAEMMQAVIDAVRSGEIPEARIRESAARILDVKARYGLFGWQPLDPATVDSRIDRAAHEAQIEALYPAAITVVYDHNQLVPVQDGANALLIYPASRPSIQATCQQYRSDIRWLGVSQSPTPQDIAWAAQAATDVDSVIVFTEDAVDNVAQQLLVQALPPQKTVAVALGSPFDWQYYPEVAAYVLTYSPAPAAVDAACRVLLDAAPAPGVLPVHLSNVLRAGTGDP